MCEPLPVLSHCSDLWVLSLGAFLAGVVRGFAGFGTAMIYLPFAAQVLTPFAALTTLIVKDLVAPLMHVPRAMRDGQPSDLIWLMAGVIFCVPLGVWVLSQVGGDVFRWGVSLVTLGMLAILILGLRYTGPITRPLTFGAGGIGGFLAGSVGLPGPPVILLYMASTLPAATVRATLTMYLILADIVMLGVLGWNGYIVAAALALGALMIVPYLLGNWLGAALFRPDYETLYRRVAYAIIAGSAILGLPIWRG
ncbi:MAG: sulfite exporter TauE/SafE family protein [Pseudomonadota bacterium]